MSMIERVKGTQDVLNKGLYTQVEQKLAEIFMAGNYTQIETPIIEHRDLFMHAVGSETDVVSKEMYTLTATNETDILCLRPEATASTVRAYVQNAVTAKPWRVFSCGPMFRHERPQKGRYRQFTQFNIEAINIPQTPAQEALFILFLHDLFQNHWKLNGFTLSINYLGTREERAIHRTALHAFVAPHHETLCATCNVRIEKNILRIFDCKNEQCQALYAQAPRITDFLTPESSAAWNSVQDILRIANVSFVLNSSLVRGLDYYARTVFEFASPHLGAQSAFCGGGFYDLSGQCDLKEALPAVGAAIGLERFYLLLEAEGRLLPEPVRPLTIVTPLSEAETGIATLLLQALWGRTLTAQLNEEKSLAKALQRSAKLGARFAVVIGETERTAGTCFVKDLASGESFTLPQVDVVTFVQSRT